MYPLFNPEKFYLLPLSIKIGHTKNSVKEVDYENAGFTYFKNKLRWVSDAKIKEWVRLGPQIRELIQDVKFEDQPGE
jgi:hypothetical protein